MTAMAMMRGRKIWRIPTSMLCGFFSGSAVEDAGEGELALKRSSIAISGLGDVRSREIRQSRTGGSWEVFEHINPHFTPRVGVPNAVIRPRYP